jgi:hypothetical protein
LIAFAGVDDNVEMNQLVDKGGELLQINRIILFPNMQIYIMNGSLIIYQIDYIFGRTSDFNRLIIFKRDKKIFVVIFRDIDLIVFNRYELLIHDWVVTPAPYLGIQFIKINLIEHQK